MPHIATNSGIYIIHNLINNKIYIGSAVDINKRLCQHRSNLRGQRHINSHLQHAWDKYGKDSFEFKVIIHCEPILLLHYEQMYIDEYEWDMLYNINPVAGSSLGMKHTDNAKKNMSKASKGKKKSPEHCANISKGQKNKKLTLETRKRISEAQKGNKYCLGRVMSSETREKISKANKGKAKKSRKIPK
jgi:group I intron endonuclease